MKIIRAVLIVLALSILVKAPISSAQQHTLAQASPSNTTSPPKDTFTIDPALLGIVGAWITIMQFYFERRKEARETKRARFEFIKELLKEIKNQEGVRNILAILNSTGYRNFSIQFPGADKPTSFNVTDELLIKALKSPEEVSKIQNGILKFREKPEDADTTKLVEQYEEVLSTELTIREWFDQFFSSLSEVENSIHQGICSADDYRPYIGDWILRLCDNEYKLKSSAAYLAIHSYIHRIGYVPLLKLLDRFGYKVVASQYSWYDFSDFSQKSLVNQALSLAKASKLIYEDQDLIERVVELWLDDHPEQDIHEISDEDYLKSNLRRKLNEGIQSHENKLYANFFYVKNSDGVGALAFKTQTLIVLVFLSENESKTSSATNVKYHTRLVRLSTEVASIDPLEEDWKPAKGYVHRGFKAAWKSIEESVVRQLAQWNEGRSTQMPLLITGHGLGGALATIAAASLVKRNFNIQSVFTFGQPRVGDFIFSVETGLLLKDKFFRYVNGDDIVPHIPPPYLPWNPFGLYAHVGQIVHIDDRGNLKIRPNPTVRSMDLLIGLLRDTFSPNFSMIDDNRIEAYINNLIKVSEIEKAREASRFM